MIDKEAIEILKDDEIHITDSFYREFRTTIADKYTKAFQTILNLIQTQQEEIEKNNKRISDLEFALMDMTLQFADENKDSISTMGLSALEIAFNELDFDNPMSIKEVHEKYKKLAQKYYE